MPAAEPTLPDSFFDSALAAPPRPPVDLDRFSSNTLFGEPGIYPGGSPMVPAAGPAPDEPTAARLLAAVGIADADARLAEPSLVARAPDPGPRAGLVALASTVGASLVDAFLAGHTPVALLAFGVPAGPGRVVGPGGDGPASHRFVNERYRAEHPALFAGSLAHDLLWSGPAAGQHEEATLHALAALVHAQLLARAPFLAGLGTELARRQNSLAITLLNSRHPGTAEVALVAADGPGTIPGGAPGMQTPDFWSIPFVSGPPRATAAPPLLAPPLLAPPLLATVLAAIVDDGATPPSPLRYDDGLGAWLSEHGMRRALPPDAQWRANVALGLLDGSTDGPTGGPTDGAAR